jgi:hypothetical protein
LLRQDERSQGHKQRSSPAGYAGKDSCGNHRSLRSPGTGSCPSTRPPPSQNIEYSLLHVAALVSCRPSSPDSPTQSTHNSIPWASSPCAPPRATVGSPDIGRTSPRPLHGHSPPQRVGQQVNLEASLAGRSRGNLSPISDKSLENAGTSITEEAKDVERSRFGRPNEK